MTTAPDDKQGGAAGTAYDSKGQKWLRNTVAQEIEDLMVRHDVGGIILLNSKEASAWRFVIPGWAGLYKEDAGGWRFKWKKEEREKADLTAHLVLRSRDMAMHVADFFQKLSTVLERQVAIDHDPIEHFDRIKNPKKGDA